MKAAHKARPAFEGTREVPGLGTVAVWGKTCVECGRPVRRMTGLGWDRRPVGMGWGHHVPVFWHCGGHRRLPPRDIDSNAPAVFQSVVPNEEQETSDMDEQDPSEVWCSDCDQPAVASLVVERNGQRERKAVCRKHEHGFRYANATLPPRKR